jgi:capsular polysaccharide biosynthesis protein
VERLRRRWLLILTLAAVGAGAAAAFAFTAEQRYDATAEFLVAPVPANDPTFVGLDVLQNGGGTHAAAESAARLVHTPQVAEAVRLRLGSDRSARSLLDEMHADALGASNVVAVTVRDSNPARAAQIANAFVDALIEVRTASFQSELQTALRRTRRALVSVPPNQRLTGQGAELTKRLAALQSLVGTNDPTIRHASQAVVPTASSWPHPIRLTLIGLAAGLGAGLVLALLLELLRPMPGAVTERAVSDRVVDRLEQRLGRRVEDLAAERERLTAREAGLAARERDIERKLAELRAHLSAPSEPSDTLSQGVLAAAEERLQERIAEVSRREQALAKRAAPLALREQELRDRSERLEARTRELDERSRSLDELATELDARERAAPPPPPPEPEREPEPSPEPEDAVPAAEAPPEPLPAAAGGFARWNLHELENLVRSRGDEYPDRVPEWESYLFFLRDYAASDGSVPETFDWLIKDAFSELVA